MSAGDCSISLGRRKGTAPANDVGIGLLAIYSDIVREGGKDRDIFNWFRIGVLVVNRACAINERALIFKRNCELVSLPFPLHDIARADPS